MMKKLLVLFILAAIPAYAGVYEDAVKKNNKVFLYMYTPDCSACRYFDKTYDEISKEHGDYTFVKVDANTPYGRHLMMKFKARYVPYIILTKSKGKKNVNISHSCVMNEVCLTRALKSFKS